MCNFSATFNGERLIDLSLAYAKMAGAISYAKVKNRHDKVDAKTLAELVNADLIPVAYQIQHGENCGS